MVACLHAVSVIVRFKATRRQVEQRVDLVKTCLVLLVLGFALPVNFLNLGVLNALGAPVGIQRLVEVPHTVSLPRLLILVDSNLPLRICGRLTRSFC